MTRRYIQSFISMKYARVLPMLSFVIFACAFIYFRKGTQNAKTAALIAACILIVVMFFYYKAKFTVNREWKKIPDAKEFDDSIMLGYAFLLEHGFIGDETSLAEWLFLMGFTTACPDEVKPIVWLKTVETARVMLRRLFAPLIDGRRLTVARMGELASQCFTKQGVPLRLAKAKKEYSQDVAAIEDFLPTVPDL